MEGLPTASAAIARGRDCPARLNAIPWTRVCITCNRARESDRTRRAAARLQGQVVDAAAPVTVAARAPLRLQQYLSIIAQGRAVELASRRDHRHGRSARQGLRAGGFNRPEKGPGSVRLIGEDRDGAQRFVDTWRRRVEAMPNARHRSLGVILGETLEQMLLRTGRRGPRRLLGRRADGASTGGALPVRWIGADQRRHRTRRKPWQSTRRAGFCGYAALPTHHRSRRLRLH